jgi:hypothetical protein
MQSFVHAENLKNKIKRSVAAIGFKLQFYVCKMEVRDYLLEIMKLVQLL